MRPADRHDSLVLNHDEHRTCRTLLQPVFLLFILYLFKSNNNNHGVLKVCLEKPSGVVVGEEGCCGRVGGAVANDDAATVIDAMSVMSSLACTSVMHKLDVNGTAVPGSVGKLDHVKRNCIKEQVDGALRLESIYQTSLAHLLDYSDAEEEGGGITLDMRNAVVANVRGVNMFYNYPADTFAISVNLLDRFISKVKAKPKHLACIGMACHHLAMKVVVAGDIVPGVAELINLNHLQCTNSDLNRMESIIQEKLKPDTEIVTPLSFLRLFLAALIDSHVISEFPEIGIVSKLEVCMCYTHCAKLRAPVLALALLMYELEEGGTEHLHWVSAVMAMQRYCLISDETMVYARGVVQDTLAAYNAKPVCAPRLQLTWPLSKRTMAQLRPSTRTNVSLPTIYEDGHPLSDGADTTSDESSVDVSSLSSSPEDKSFLVLASTELAAQQAEH